MDGGFGAPGTLGTSGLAGGWVPVGRSAGFGVRTGGVGTDVRTVPAPAGGRGAGGWNGGRTAAASGSVAGTGTPAPPLVAGGRGNSSEYGGAWSGARPGGVGVVGRPGGVAGWGVAGWDCCAGMSLLALGRARGRWSRVGPPAPG
ncbi:hypothetical protein UO65_0913 [Actinokineospora spheciospongiae]|uniref:Uncharacterized protein n=1 Tax=Actinokineospora spheciospongiae TaxID=909613 RepID=W7ITS1_9PSEU|nr:hypothetical protein UO65_0913 [Actinokineospora spheciospongiae]